VIDMPMNVPGAGSQHHQGRILAGRLGESSKSTIGQATAGDAKPKWLMTMAKHP
jgi:hypothetical protein